jgi:formylglycine-generating enzyme required for sulfatase activity
MLGNVFEWVEDCYENSYVGAPTDGSARTGEDCIRRVLRGGSWLNSPRVMRSAYRLGNFPVIRGNIAGFRVGRTLSARGGAITVSPGAQ